MPALLALLLSLVGPAAAASIRVAAFDSAGKPLTGGAFLTYIAPQERKSGQAAAQSGVYVTDLDDNPVAGRPWVDAASKGIVIRWEGAPRVKISLPWPVQDDGFSTVTLDREGAGYADHQEILLNEEIAVTQYRLFRESIESRRASWEPTYKPSGKAKDLERKAQAAMADAKKGRDLSDKAALYERALTAISVAWAKVLFEHGRQCAGHPRVGASLRWGLTLDDTLVSRPSEFEWIAKQLSRSGANWVRIVFRLNPSDFFYTTQRSFNDYDAIIAELTRAKIHVMASVLDSTLWPKNLEPASLVQRTHNLVIHYQNQIRSWEVASEPNGNWLGGWRSPLPDDTVIRAVADAAAEVKKIDRSLEAVATLYWWEGTAGDDRHPTFAWLKRATAAGALRNIDLVGLSVYPEDNPMGLAFEPVFRRLNRYVPDKKLMLGAFGYVPAGELKGYWWLDPADTDGARKDLVILYSGAAASIPKTAGGGYWWPTLSTMLKVSRDEDGLYKIYRRTLQNLGRR